MSAVTMELHDIIDVLDDTQLDALHKVAVCFLNQRNFDYISPDDSKRIRQAHEEMLRGECVSFESVGEMTAHFGAS